MIEPELRGHMRACADAFAAASSVELVTVAEKAAGDWRFFERIEQDKTFTIRKYDAVMSWFSEHWPADAPWPPGIPRPMPPAAEAATPAPEAAS